MLQLGAIVLSRPVECLHDLFSYWPTMSHVNAMCEAPPTCILNEHGQCCVKCVLYNTFHTCLLFFYMDNTVHFLNWRECFILISLIAVN